MQGDLTTLATVKAWVGLDPAVTAADAVLTRLVSAQSRFVQSWLNRKIASQPYTEVRDGTGMGAGRFVMRFEDYPVTAVSSLTINGQVIAASSDGGVLQSGYGFDSEQIWLAPSSASCVAGAFVRGRRNVTVTYTAGFLVLPDGVASTDSGLLPAEVRTIPTTPFQVTPQMTWLSDNGVKHTGGAALTKVASSPTTGQYSVDATGVYTFAAADVGLSVSLSYSYVPSDLEQAVVEIVGYRYQERNHIGLTRKTINSVGDSYYDVTAIPQPALAILNQYRKIASYS